MKNKVAIHGKPFGAEEKSKLEDFFNKLATCSFLPLLSEEFYRICSDASISNLDKVQVYQSKTELEEVQYAFSFGGDGTLLDLLTHVAELEIPIIGVNMGRLGFLATTSLDSINQAVESLRDRNYEIDNRIMVQMESDQNLFNGENFALNDFAILKRDTSSMIKVKVMIEGVYLNTYWSDGIIISTPTGSTGYSLSCGGPLVLPQSNNFVITPVSPHNLNARPLIVSDHSEISFEIEARSDNVLVSLDSRSIVVPADVQIKVKKFNKLGKLVKFKDFNQFETMRNKLNWGIDYRNWQ